MTFRRPNPVFSDEYRAIVETVIEARREAGLTQREVAARLAKAASHVSMIERGQRRIDSLEFHDLALALGRDPPALYAAVCRRIEAARAAATPTHASLPGALR